MDVDKATLQHKKYANVFALGDSADASALPTSKTMGAWVGGCVFFLLLLCVPVHTYCFFALVCVPVHIGDGCMGGRVDVFFLFYVCLSILAAAYHWPPTCVNLCICRYPYDFKAKEEHNRGER